MKKIGIIIGSILLIGVIAFSMAITVAVPAALAQDEAEARSIAAESIVEEPGLYRDRVLVVELEAVDPELGDRYRTFIWLEGDPGEVNEYRGEATFRARRHAAPEATGCVRASSSPGPPPPPGVV